ncbi:hypothetical protein CDO73_11470 [Saccharibacillus sp. O23]|uniref:DUF3600 domain-containing protein n=1 Tax=Saccharibacillus sp. O23 TaxID=2009338 RepID=UPI000B4E1902|nr:DUF3600 domain-containing protein [Saccharibacillus sp. O23]OWR30523.1 hypothetical protein CDO73_11470 [Saccharibacillus sp. O23]
MKLENEIRYSLQKKVQGWELPISARHELMQRIDRDRLKSRRTRTKLIPICIAAALIVPTGAFAGYHYLADSIYGSSSTVMNLKKDHLEQYEHMEAKLQAAKAQLSEAEYDHLSKLLSEAAEIYTTNMDASGQLDTASMNKEELNRLTELEQELRKASAGINAPDKSDIPQPTDYKTFLKNLLEEGKKSLSPEKYTTFSRLVEESIVIVEKYEKDQEMSPAQDSENLARLTELNKQLQSYFEEMGYVVKEAK